MTAAGKIVSTLMFLTCFATIATAQSDQIQIKDVWTRATIGKPSVGAVFMTITSPTSDRLVSASTPIANRTDLMTMVEKGNGVTGMRYLKDIPIPAKEPVSLNPMELHVWLDGLKQPLKAGETFNLTLNFEKAGQREVTVVIKPITFTGTTVLAASKDYAFKAMNATVNKGDGVVVSVLLTKKGKPVAGAEVVKSEISMAPDGMEDMKSPVTPITRSQPGVYSFKTDLTMEGRWLLTILAKVPDEPAAIAGKVVFRAK